MVRVRDLPDAPRSRRAHAATAGGMNPITQPLFTDPDRERSFRASQRGMTRRGSADLGDAEVRCSLDGSRLAWLHLRDAGLACEQTAAVLQSRQGTNAP